MATICEERPPDSVMLIYLSTSGIFGHCSTSQAENSGMSRKYTLTCALVNNHHELWNGFTEDHINNKECNSSVACSNILYPGDIILFTRKPLFLIIDSDNSHAFKA
ncbi:hypothetical protein STAS_18239, partial [Striga asiatica]